MALKSSNPAIPEIEKEVRFAVVMYGGVSLAIYINGVAQELFKMVRATATKKKDGSYFIDTPKGTEAIYRKLGAELKARFVVDVLSGTSAGGINAVYLAKALSNDQDMSELEKMWIQEGDIQSLINDEASVKEINVLSYARPPKSLLNSDRIYYKLLSALENMDDKSSPSDTSPFVDELDLYVTSTDLIGVARPILLKDRETLEKRFRAVFRFHYSILGDESYWLKPFRRENNPFLAFAARATCALPAFRPARLDDTLDLQGQLYSKMTNYAELTNHWSNFPRDYNFEADLFRQRSFGDGGALDNKPFSYITETLLRRQSDVPIDRRLFFIEPAPEHPELTDQKQLNEPDMIRNLVAQGFGLPRYETIREDLIQIKTRNELIERTNSVLRQIERTRVDIGNWEGAKKGWQSQYLDRMLVDNDLYGSGYAAYHQLRMADVLDHFASTVARNIGIDEESSDFAILRQVFDGWRRSKYSTHASDKLPSENELLFRLDLDWRLRRLSFLLKLIDKIRQGIKGFRSDLGTRDLSSEEQAALEIVQYSVQKKEASEYGHTWSITNPSVEKLYLDALYEVKASLNQAYVQLKNKGRRLRQRNLALRSIDSKDFVEDSNLIDYVRALQPFVQIRGHIMQAFKERSGQEKAWDDLERLSLVLASRQMSKQEKPTGYLYRTLSEAAHACEDELSPKGGDDHTMSRETSSPVRESVRTCLKFYYDNFEYYDKITFPITYATPVGESDIVDVYRISPEDANALFQERKDKRKLAGTKYFNFGAFFKEEWRQNDILWGQLDGAERIITTLLPDPKTDDDQRIRDEYLVRAWLTILKEKRDILGPQNLANLQLRLANVEKLQNGSENVWQRFESSQEFSSAEIQALKGELSSFFDQDYQVEPKPSAEIISNVITRSVQVLDELFTDLVEKYFSTRSVWVGRLIRGLIALVPGTVGNASLRRWLKTAYGIELLVFAVSILVALAVGAILGFNKVLFWLGFISLVVTGIIHWIVQSLGRRILNSLLSWL
jgi:patatin-related protein